MGATKVVYLDQKGWIDLAKSNKETLDVITNSSKSGSAIFPLSIVHLDETCKIHDLRRRQELASLMVTISKGYCFLPYVDQIVEAEVRQEVLKRFGFPTIELRNYVLKKGICHMLGVKPEIVKRKGAKVPDQSPDEVKKKILDFLDTPEVLRTILTEPHKCDPKIRQLHKEAVEKMEQARKDFLKIKYNTIRRKTVLATFLMT